MLYTRNHTPVAKFAPPIKLITVSCTSFPTFCNHLMCKGQRLIGFLKVSTKGMYKREQPTFNRVVRPGYHWLVPQLV